MRLPSLIVAVATLACIAPSLWAEPAGWSTDLRLGYDYFSHNYQIIDRDTTNAFSEGSIGLTLTYRPPTSRTAVPQGRAELFYGKDYWQAEAEIENGPTYSRSWFWRAEINAREYQPWTSLSFSNDHVSGEARLRYRHPISKSLDLEFSDRVYGINYEERTEFLYDSYLNDASAAVRIGDILANMLDLDLSHRNLFVPDSSAIEYTSDELCADYFWMPGLQTMFTGRASTEWRRYTRGSPRSNFVRTEGDVRLDRRITDVWRIETVLGIEAESYETADPIFHDSRTYRFQIGPGVDLSDYWDLEILPGVEIYDVSSFDDPSAEVSEDLFYFQESYSEFMIEAITDYFRIPRFWCDLSARVGHRNYEAEEEALDSDYWYVDLAFLAELMLWDDVRLDVTGLFSPEKHRNPEDNTATNVVSVVLGYRF